MTRLRWAALALAGAVTVLLAAAGTSDGSRPTYLTAAVTRTDLSTTVTATGAVHPVVRVDVGSQLSGQVAELYVDYNDVVARGQPMARLDPEAFEARVREAEAALESAETHALIRLAMADEAAAAHDAARASRTVLDARLAQAAAGHDEARREFERKRQLHAQGTIPVSELEGARARADEAAAARREAEAELEVHAAEVQEAEAAVRVAEAELANARATVKQQAALLEQARVDLARTTIRAPIDGVVIRRDVDRGQTVAASLESPTLFTLAEDLRRMAVHARLDEADIGAVRLGQRATFVVDAYPEKSFAGTVVQIRKAPDVVQSVVTYTVLVSADNPDLALFPGMTATVRIVVAETPGALAVPTAALRFRPAEAGRAPAPAAAEPAAGGGRATVWVLDDAGAPAPVEIEVGQGGVQLTAIVAGALAEGDRVIVGRDAAAGETGSGFGIRFGF